MHRRLGADIYALGGLIKDDDFRRDGKPFGNDEFLLIAAGEFAKALAPVRGADVEALAQPAGGIEF